MSLRNLVLASTLALLAAAGCSRDDQADADRTLDQAGDRVEEAAGEAGQAVEKAADDVGPAVEKGARSATEAARKAGDKVEEGTERLNEQIREIGREHPDSVRRP